MKAVLVFACLAVAVAVAVPADKFTTKYDNVDVDAIVKNKRLFKAYVNCILNGEKCTPEGQTLRDAIPEALTNDCAGCSEKQREIAEKVLPIVINEHPADWAKLKAKFDPTGQYSKKYQDIAAKKNIKI